MTALVNNPTWILRSVVFVTENEYSSLATSLQKRAAPDIAIAELQEVIQRGAQVVPSGAVQRGLLSKRPRAQRV